ncbi:hypothetical protein HN789_00760 [archaeon]|jgi:4-amino-4-deoxy-L-arabinose transferase-like glycosyltransferase|nr:hypothetical protein [Candidatus Woesearchaeota archaeon]MBT3464412.1 hypothetical protein [archaeon]MBT3721351.1 hypothetical protein [archaeon]MBT4022059.1 hypothetical protein [archaeon]MBT4272672.1 hypothetical protein [archaeon]
MKKHNEKKYLYGILVIILVFSIFNIFWIIKDTRPLSHEDLNSVYGGDFLYHNLHNYKNNIFSVTKELHYPPFIPYLTYVSYILFGVNDNVPLLINVLFIPVLILSLFYICKELYDSKIGFVASLFLVSFPQIIVFSRTMFDSFISLSLFSLGLYFFIKSKNFSDHKFSIFYGIVFSLSILTRYTSILFLIAPIIYFLIINFKHLFFSIKELYSKNTIFKLVLILLILTVFKLIYRDIKTVITSSVLFEILILIWLYMGLSYIVLKPNDSKFSNFFSFVSIIMAISGPWYFFKIKGFFANYFGPQALNDIIGPNITCYLKNLVLNQIGFILSLLILSLIVINVILFKKKRKIIRSSIFILFIFFFGFISYALLPMQGSWFNILVLIPLAILFARLTENIDLKLQKIVLVFLIIHAFFLVIPISNDSLMSKIIYEDSLIKLKPSLAPCFFVPEKITLLPKDNFHHDSNLLTLYSNSNTIISGFEKLKELTQKNSTTKILVLLFDDYMNKINLDHYALLNNLTWDIQTLYEPQKFNFLLVLNESNKIGINGTEYLLNFDIILLPIGKYETIYWKVNKNYYDNFLLLDQLIKKEDSQFSKIFDFENPFFCQEECYKTKIAVYAKN